MLCIRNYCDTLPKSLKIEDQIQHIANHVGDGMDYGFHTEIKENGDKSYTVYVKCNKGACATQGFVFYSNAKENYYFGSNSSINLKDKNKWQFHPTLKEEFKNNFAQKRVELMETK
jgi:hypothetical protein